MLQVKGHLTPPGGRDEWDVALHQPHHSSPLTSALFSAMLTDSRSAANIELQEHLNQQAGAAGVPRRVLCGPRPAACGLYALWHTSYAAHTLLPIAWHMAYGPQYGSEA